MLNIYFKIKVFQIVYNHEEIYDFVVNNIFASSTSTQSKPLSLMLTSPQSLEKRRFSFGTSRDRDFKWLMSKIMVKCCAELWNLSVLTKLNEKSAALHISHTKILLDQIDERRTNIYSNQFLQTLLNTRHWSTELMIESFWWSLDHSNNEAIRLHTHTKGNPFYVGVSLIKLSSYGNATKLDLSIHTLRVEYKQYLAEFLLKLKDCYSQYGFETTRKPVAIQRSRIEEDNDDAEVERLNLLIDAKITDVSVFLFTNYDACIAISLNETSLVRSQQLTVLKVNELHMAIQKELSKISSNSLDLNESTELFMNVKAIRVEYLAKQKPKIQKDQLSVHIVNDSVIMWNPNLHMQCLMFVRDFISFKNTILPCQTDDIGQAQYKPIVNSSDDEKSSVAQKNILLEIYVESTVELAVKVSERHSMNFLFENFFFSRKEQTMFSVNKIFINIDEAHIFTLLYFSMESAPSLDYLQRERINYDHFTLKTNKVWITSIGSFKVIFPYDHDFAEAVQSEFNSLIKWLKVTHGRTSKPFSENAPLPSDMVIRVKEFLLEMSDDPFEVKLRDNYVLLVDEYHESIKRQELFDQKIQVLCADRLLLPADTLAELQASLIRKNSEIYIQRSKKIKEAGPTRTRLFAWILNDLKIMTMADPTIHGVDNVIEMIQEIDAESPWPEEGLEFATLWCRAVNISCSEWKFMLR